MSTSQAPKKPLSSGVRPSPRPESRSLASPPGLKVRMKAAAPMKVGSTSGTGSTTRQNRRPGRSVRAVSQARVVPSADAASDTPTARRRVRPSGPRVRGEKSSPSGSAPSVKLRHTR